MSGLKEDPIDLTLEVLVLELQRLREVARGRTLDEKERWAFDTYAKHAVAIHRIETVVKRSKGDDLSQLTDEELDAYEARLREKMAS